jgi:Zn-dependent M28 family amino/carboxypeptidase
MRRTIAAATTVAVMAALAAASPALAHGGKGHHDRDPGTQLARAVTVDGVLKHARAFQRIADRNEGNRASGLPGYDASADYVANRLERAGYEVTRQTFTFPFWRNVTAPTLTQTAPGSTEYETGSFTYSGSGDVSGAVVPVDLTLPPSPEPSSTSGCEAADFTPAPAAPTVALVQRGSCDFAVKVANAVAAGYDAVIIFNEGQPGRTDLVTGTLGAPVDVPVVGLSFADGSALAQTAGAQVRVTTQTETDLARETENVIADLPSRHHRGKGHGKGYGRGHDRGKHFAEDEVVVVGAHLDSVTEGPGINDNGSGSGTVLEIAEELAERGFGDLRRPVRFAFWGAEEAGLLGSEHYVASLSPDELASIHANLNFDMLGSPNYVRFVYDGDGSEGGDAGPEGSAQIEEVFTDYFESRGLASEPTDFDGRSDYGPFIAAGIPAGGLFSGAEGVKTPEQAAVYGGTAGEPYDACYHQACDDLSNLSNRALSELGDAAAYATATLLTSRDGFSRDDRPGKGHHGKGHHGRKHYEGKTWRSPEHGPRH